jgi:hypothetical protein
MMRFIGSGMRFISAGCWLIAAMLILSSALFGADTGVRPLIQTQGNSAELSLPGTDAIKTGGLSKDLHAWTPVIYPRYMVLSLLKKLLLQPLTRSVPLPETNAVVQERLC